MRGKEGHAGSVEDRTDRIQTQQGSALLLKSNRTAEEGGSTRLGRDMISGVCVVRQDGRLQNFNKNVIIEVADTYLQYQ